MLPKTYARVLILSLLILTAVTPILAQATSATGADGLPTWVKDVGAQHVPKGKRMAGRYGASRVTVRNLRIVRIDGDNHIVLVRGAVPGPNGSLVMIRPTNKK